VGNVGWGGGGGGGGEGGGLRGSVMTGPCSLPCWGGRVVLRKCGGFWGMLGSLGSVMEVAWQTEPWCTERARYVGNLCIKT